MHGPSARPWVHVINVAGRICTPLVVAGSVVISLVGITMGTVLRLAGRTSDETISG